MVIILPVLGGGPGEKKWAARCLRHLPALETSKYLETPMSSVPALRPPVKTRSPDGLCDQCAGTGFQPLQPPLDSVPCDTCDGTGTRPVQVRAPSVPCYFALAGDEVVQAAKDVTWLLRDLVEHGIQTDLCLWRQEGDDWEPAWTLVGVLRPQVGGGMAVTWL